MTKKLTFKKVSLHIMKLVQGLLWLNSATRFMAGSMGPE